jgi:hypothetical protein
MADWFYLSGEAELGPFSSEQMQELLARGEIGADTMYRKKSWMDWQPAASVELLSAKLASPDTSNAELRFSPSDLAGTPVAEREPAALPVSEQDELLRRKIIVGVAAGALLIAVAAVGIYLATRPGGGRPAKQPAGPVTDVSTTTQPVPSPSRKQLSQIEAREILYQLASPEDQELLDWIDMQSPPGPRRYKLSPEDLQLLEWLDAQWAPGPPRPAKSSAKSAARP